MPNLSNGLRIQYWRRVLLSIVEYRPYRGCIEHGRNKWNIFNDYWKKIVLLLRNSNKRTAELRKEERKCATSCEI